MKRNVYQPFNRDVLQFGGYQYTSSARKSAITANERMTKETLRGVSLAGQTVVDIGCGDGTYTAELFHRGQPKSLLGIDPADQAIAQANNAFSGADGKLCFRSGYSSTLLADGLAFDVAIYRGVLHHVQDPREEIRRALQLARLVLFIEPNGYNPVVKLLEFCSPYHRAHEERSYPPARLRRWVREEGGSVEQAWYGGLVPFFAPDFLVQPLRGLEPIIEALPGVRTMLCGQYYLRARSLNPGK